MKQQMTLTYEVNPFQGAVLDTEYLPSDSISFNSILQQTLIDIHKKELQLVWLYLPLSRADLVEPSVNLGFSYHHADKNGLQLVFRINQGVFVPEYATHYIGVGGVLIDNQDKILVIQERHHTRKHYKLPGGALDPGEHIAHAAVREVFEETGIHSQFVSLNCFRHWHGYRYGKSDIYFVCRMKPLNFTIKIETSEISEARWMPLDEYLNDPDTHPFNRKIVSTSLTSTGLKPGSIPEYGSPETHEMMF